MYDMILDMMYDMMYDIIYDTIYDMIYGPAKKVVKFKRNNVIKLNQEQYLTPSASAVLEYCLNAALIKIPPTMQCPNSNSVPVPVPVLCGVGLGQGGILLAVKSSSRIDVVTQSVRPFPFFTFVSLESEVHLECLGVQRVFQGSFKGVSIVFNTVSRVYQKTKEGFQGSFKCILRRIQDCLKTTLRGFQVF